MKYDRACRRIASLLALAIFLPASSMPQQEIDGRMDIGGRKLRILCMGEASPVVVIDAGMGMSAVENQAWRSIAQRLSPLAKICLFDRAGLGGSDPASLKIRTSMDAAKDLNAALSAAGLKPPFLLVGHSVGGLNALVFADRFPSAVAGLVLVSSSHPGQFDAWRSAIPAPTQGEDAAITRARDYLAIVDRTPGMNPESLDLGESNRQARNLKSVGAKPVVIVTHSPAWKMVAELPDDVAARLEAQTQQLQKQFLSLSTRSSQLVAVSAGHDLPGEDPALVIEAIEKAIGEVRNP